MPDVIAQVTIQAGRVPHPPGAVVTIDDADEARRLVERGDAEWAGEAQAPQDEGEPNEASTSTNPLAGVDFASDEAAEAAAKATVKGRGLMAADFAEFNGHGRDGAFTKGDVLAITKELSREEDE